MKIRWEQNCHEFHLDMVLIGFPIWGGGAGGHWIVSGPPAKLAIYYSTSTC